MARHRGPPKRRASDGPGSVLDRNAPADGSLNKELRQNHDVSPSWLFTLLRRYRLEGPEGLEPRSRRPKRSPGRIAGLFEDEIVALRKELLDAGFDAGAETIAVHLGARHNTVPSVSTIWRVLKARGFVTPQPHKRPQSSLRRFEADLPNECWQADMTHVRLEDGAVFEVLNIVDDHSRLCIAARAMVRVKAPDVIRVLHKAAETWGYPASFLSDNGLIFSTQSRYGLAGATEQELFSLGIRAKHSPSLPSPDLRKGRALPPDAQEVPGRPRGHHDQEAAPSARLDRFVDYYNNVRPHRSLGRTTPAVVLAGGPRPSRAHQSSRREDGACASTRWASPDRSRCVTAASSTTSASEPPTGTGASSCSSKDATSRSSVSTAPLRRLVLDPAKNYQPQP